jgi:hypothetical protein
MSTILPGFFRPLGFDPLSLEPVLAFSAQSSMLEAGGAAAENLDLVPTLQNLVSGGANASQSTASKQPRAHVPLGDGHLYLPGVSGNYASVPDANNLDGFGDFALEFVGSSEDWHAGLAMTLIGKWNSSGGYFVRLQANGTLFFLYNTSGGQNYHYSTAAHNLVDGAKGGIRVIRDGSSIKFYENLFSGNGWQQIGSNVSGSATTLVNGSQALEVGTYNGGNAYPFNGPVLSTKIWNSSSPDTASPVLDIDFSDGDHKASSFTCSTGQTVTVHRTGSDPATLIGRNVLRFDGSNDYIGNSLSSDLNTAHAFIKFAVNGDTFSSTAPTTMALYRTEHWLTNAAAMFIGVGTTSTNARTFIGATVMQQSGKWNDDNETIIAEISISDGAHFSKVNNANLLTDSRAYSLNSNKFRIGAGSTSGNASIDVEQIYLFDFVLSSGESAKMFKHLE